MKKGFFDIKVIIILIISFYVVITIAGCDISKLNAESNIEPSDTKVLRYISENINYYNQQIQENKEICEITSKENSELGHKYLKFNIDDTTTIQFNINAGSVSIEKNTKYWKEQAIVKIHLKDINDKYACVRIDYETGGTWCKYKINDFENPIPDDGEYEQAHYIITQSIKPEELKELCLKAHSIYDKLEEIYKKNNL
ncbi:hypothetical protein FDF11_06865 [Clostridium botulinum]|nr:hypothetical protein [Clostridium botulinum]NFR15349.1 hypothetical protein [Clostridium botulinum]NFR45067.1 hypothetical protein [Clostridium botulinum]NFS50406.1 hypothetical protein [Clostridium botulinum]